MIKGIMIHFQKEINLSSSNDENHSLNMHSSGKNNANYASIPIDSIRQDLLECVFDDLWAEVRFFFL